MKNTGPILAEIETFLEDHERDIIDFACKLVATPSENPPGDESAIAEVITAKAVELGLPEPRVVAREPHRPNLVFEIMGDETGPRLMYNGHIDTKPVGDLSKWNTDPLNPVIKDGFLYGLGASDMKGGVAALLYAAAAIARVQDKLKGSLLLVLTGDEEAGGAYGAEYLAKNDYIHADIGLIAEGCGIREEWEYLNLISRGETCFKIKVYGTQMHSSVCDVLPSVNASLKMAEVMLKLAKELKFRYEPHPLCPQGVTMGVATVVNSGVYYGVLPGYAEFGTDVRTLPGMTREAMEEDIRGFVERLRLEDPTLEIDYEFEPLPLGWIETVVVPEDHPFVDALKVSAGNVLGKVPQLGAYPAWTDARFFQHVAGVPTIPAFGPGLLTVAHGPNERVLVESIVKASRIYALSGARYLSMSKDG